MKQRTGMRRKLMWHLADTLLALASEKIAFVWALPTRIASSGQKEKDSKKLLGRIDPFFFF